MNSLQYINISSVILSSIVCLILLICVITTDYRKEKLNRIFVSVVSCHIMLLLVDMVIFILGGGAKAYLIFQTAYCLSFILGSVLLILFTRYLRAFIEIKTTVSRRAVYFSYGAIAVCGVNIICIILTQINGMYYLIEEGNVFYQGNWYWLSQLLAAVCISINTGIIIAYRKSFEMREMVSLSCYTALPVLALVVQNVIEGTIASIDIATMLTIVIFYAGIQSEQAKLLKQKELELSESRIAVMLSQIQPHFLYNSLTAIGKLCDIDSIKAKAAITDFADYLRGNLESVKKRKLIYFEDELEHIEAYLSLEQLRYKERLQVEYEISVKDFILPPLTVQPIVENAVQHGLMEKREGGTVVIRTESDERIVRITVSDDGVGYDTASHIDDGRIHIGIENVRGRLSSLCHGRLEIHSSPGMGTTAVITLPYNTDKEDTL